MRGRAVAGSPELASSARTWLRPGFASLFELIIVITKTSHPIFVNPIEFWYLVSLTSSSVCLLLHVGIKKV